GPQFRETGDWRRGGSAANGSRYGVPQRHAARGAVRAAYGLGARAGFPARPDPRVAAAALRRARRGALPSHDPRLGPHRDPSSTLLRDGRQPRRVVRQPFLALPAAVAHRGPAGPHISPLLAVP